jgi:hypothetical protein
MNETNIKRAIGRMMIAYPIGMFLLSAIYMCYDSMFGTLSLSVDIVLLGMFLFFRNDFLKGYKWPPIASLVVSFSLLIFYCWRCYLGGMNILHREVYNYGGADVEFSISQENLVYFLVMTGRSIMSLIATIIFFVMDGLLPKGEK